jgi:hypothetical protein
MISMENRVNAVVGEVLFSGSSFGCGELGLAVANGSKARASSSINTVESAKFRSYGFDACVIACDFVSAQHNMSA